MMGKFPEQISEFANTKSEHYLNCLSLTTRDQGTCEGTWNSRHTPKGGLQQLQNGGTYFYKSLLIGNQKLFLNLIQSFSWIWLDRITGWRFAVWSGQLWEVQLWSWKLKKLQIKQILDPELMGSKSDQDPPLCSCEPVRHAVVAIRSLWEWEWSPASAWLQGKPLVTS